MLKCPMCRELLPDEARKCRKCQTDLSLLADYVDNLQEGLVQAEATTRAGELGEAVWAYLAVLEVDPDNATARRQVGKVATAVRQFDQTAPGRRWLRRCTRKPGCSAGWPVVERRGELGGCGLGLPVSARTSAPWSTAYYLGRAELAGRPHQEQTKPAEASLR